MQSKYYRGSYQDYIPKNISIYIDTWSCLITCELPWELYLPTKKQSSLLSLIHSILYYAKSMLLCEKYGRNPFSDLLHFEKGDLVV
jgi:hypothetical protein